MTGQYKWYIIHTLSGSEKRAKQMIMDQIIKHNMLSFVEDIVIPIIEVPEIKRGKTLKSEKKFLPGYILIRMDMNDEIWHLITSISKIAKFLGSHSKPHPLSDKEVQNMFSQLETKTKDANLVKLYEIGQQISVVEGPFDGFTGTVEDVDNEKARLKVSVSIFGKATPIDLNFNQVKKI